MTWCLKQVTQVFKFFWEDKQQVVTAIYLVGLIYFIASVSETFCCDAYLSSPNLFYYALMATGSDLTDFIPSWYKKLGDFICCCSKVEINGSELFVLSFPKNSYREPTVMLLYIGGSLKSKRSRSTIGSHWTFTQCYNQCICIGTPRILLPYYTWALLRFYIHSCAMITKKNISQSQPEPVCPAAHLFRYPSNPTPMKGRYTLH